MADYQIRARVPQETADKLFEFIKEEQERTPAGDVTASSVVRAALDDYINAEDYVKIPIRRLSAAETGKVLDLIKSIESESHEIEIKRFLLLLTIELFNHMDRKQRKEDPEMFKFLEIEDK